MLNKMLIVFRKDLKLMDGQSRCIDAVLILNEFSFRRQFRCMYTRTSRRVVDAYYYLPWVPYLQFPISESISMQLFIISTVMTSDPLHSHSFAIHLFGVASSTFQRRSKRACKREKNSPLLLLPSFIMFDDC